MLKKLNGMYNSSRKYNFLTKNIDIFSDFSTKKTPKKTMYVVSTHNIWFCWKTENYLDYFII